MSPRLVQTLMNEQRGEEKGDQELPKRFLLIPSPELRLIFRGFRSANEHSYSEQLGFLAFHILPKNPALLAP